MAVANGSAGNLGTGRRASTRKSDANAVVGNLELLLPGKHVVVLYNQLEQKGVVRFAGTTSFSDGQWVGVELQEANGKNNGSVLGTSYFECQDGHGIFVRPKSILRASATDQLRSSSPSRQSAQAEDCVSPDSRTKSPDVAKKVRRASKISSGSPATLSSTEESLPLPNAATEEDGLTRPKPQRVRVPSLNLENSAAEVVTGSPARNANSQPVVFQDIEVAEGPQLVSVMNAVLAEIRRSSEELQKEKKAREKAAAASRQEKKNLEYLTRRLDERMDRVDQRLDEIWKSVDQVSARASSIEESIAKKVQNAPNNSDLDNDMLTQTIKFGDGAPNTELMDVVASRVADRVRERDDELHRLTAELEGARRTMGKTAVTEIQMIALYGTEEEFLQVQRRHPWESDSHGRTAIHFAAMGGNLSVLRCAAGLDADMSVADNDGLTPTHYASACNHENTLKFLIESNADVDAEDNEERSAVDWAQWCGHVDLVTFFSTIGKRPKWLGADCPSAPHWAASAGHTALLRSFTRSGLELNSSDDFGMTPLHYAAACGHGDAVDYLIANGGSATALDNDHRDSIYWAHWCKRYDVMKRFAAEGLKRRPAVITITSGKAHRQFAGHYFLQPGYESNRGLVWSTKGSMRYLLYCNERGNWSIGDSLEEEPIVQNMIPSFYSMPDSMAGPWSFWDLDTKGWVEDSSISVMEKVESKTASEWAAARGHGGLLKCMASAGLDLDAVVQMLVKSSGVEDADVFDDSHVSMPNSNAHDEGGQSKFVAVEERFGSSTTTAQSLDDVPETTPSPQSLVDTTTSYNSVLGRTTSSNGLTKYLPMG